MIKVHALIASVLGIGLVGKGGGTLAAIFYCAAWYLLPARDQYSYLPVVTTVLLIIIGTWSSGAVHRIWGKDSSKVVIDEVAGMAIALLYVPKNFWYMLISLVAFRFFDIVKPLGIRRAEILPKGWGVMADDVLAGFYALTVIQLWMLIANKFG